MRIAIFTDTYPPFINGVSTSTYNLVKILNTYGHETIVVTPNGEGNTFEYKDGVIYIPGIEMKKLYGYRITTLFSKKAFEIIKEFKPDLIHYQTDFTIGQFARMVAKRLKVPLVYTYHTSYEDYTYYVTRGFLDRAAKKTIRAYTKYVASHVAEIISPSYKTKDFMRSVGYDTYVNIVPTGIDFSLFDEAKFDKEKAKEFKISHGINENSKIILILGRLAKEKSMDVSIRCFAHYIKTYPEKDFKLLIVGGGPARSELELLVHELGISNNVIFVGPVKASEVPFYYHLSDIYTSASVTETQGLTFMEAMSAKTIVVARFDDNLSGTIKEGETGFFFTDEKSFLEKIDYIFSLSKEEKEKIINNALTIVDKYSLEKFYLNIIEVYKRATRKYW